MKTNYADYKYTVANQPNFTLDEAVALWKAKYPEFADFKKDVIIHENLEDFGNFVEEIWDDIKPVTVEQALKISNTEIRRTYFDCIGVVKLFKELNPTLRDRQVLTKKRTKWDDNDDSLEYEFEDVYELYEIDGTLLFEKDRWGRSPNNIYAVRCWCTTTNREYWLYVNEEAALGETRWESVNQKKYDAVQAIAWTIRIDVGEDQIEKLYRQGDIIVAKVNETAKSIGWFRHLSKEAYLTKMYSET